MHAPKTEANVPTILIPPSTPGATCLKDHNCHVVPFTLLPPISELHVSAVENAIDEIAAIRKSMESDANHSMMQIAYQNPFDQTCIPFLLN